MGGGRRVKEEDVELEDEEGEMGTEADLGERETKALA
jgi:hypothetical protein